MHKLIDAELAALALTMYLHQPSMQRLRDDVAKFVRATDRF